MKPPMSMITGLPRPGMTSDSASMPRGVPTVTPAQALAPASAPVFNSTDSHKAMRDWCAISANLNQALAFCAQAASAKGV